MKPKTNKQERAQDLYLRIQDNKKAMKEERDWLKKEYMKDPKYKELDDQAKKINNEKKIIKYRIDQDNPDVITRIEDLKIDIQSDKAELDDIMTASFAEGKVLEIQNTQKQMIIPIFGVVAMKQKE